MHVRQAWVCFVFLLRHFVSASLVVEVNEEVVYAPPVDVEGAADCELEGYDLTALRDRYWAIHHTGRHSCPVPDRDEVRGHVIGCTLYFTVCGENTLPRELCDGHRGATTCLEVETNSGHSRFYHIRDVGTLEAIGPESFGGFAITRQGGHDWSHSCGKMEVVLEFICEEKMEEWNILSGDATKHVRQIEFLEETCQLKVVLGYKGACHTALPLAPAPSTLGPAVDGCLLPPYNTTHLKSQAYWYANVDNKYCYNNGIQQLHACTFNFAFCQSLPSNDPVLGSKCNGAAVCQSATVDTPTPPFDKGVAYSMGQFKGYTRFFFSGKLDSGGFYMEVENGTIPGCGDKTKTRLSLVCNSSAVWRSQDLSKLAKVEKDGECQYHIILQYSGACLPVLPNATSLSPSMNMSTIVPTMTSSAKNITSSFTNMSTIMPAMTSSTRNITSSATPSSHTMTSHTPSQSTAVTNSTVHVHPTPTHRITSSSYPNPTHSLATPTESILTTPSAPSATPIHTPVHHGNNGKMIMGLGIGLGLFGILSIIVVIVVFTTVCAVVSKRRHQPLRFINEQ